MLYPNRRYLLIVLLLWSLSGVQINAVPSGLKLNAEFVDGGTILSLNITGNEYDKSISQKTHKITLGDGQISDIWDGLTGYPAPPFGTDGEIYSVYGSSEIYFLFIHELDFNWISLQWDTSQSYTVEEMGDREMEIGDDMWIFGQTDEVSVLGDAKAHSTESIFVVEDNIENLEWDRVVVNDTDGTTPLYIAWEVKRLKVTNDISGNDVNFNTVNSTSLRIASGEHHKQDNVIYDFQLSDLRVGGDVPAPTGIVTEVDVDAEGFLIREISLGLIYGVIVWLMVFIPTGFILRNQTNKQKSEVSE